MEICTKHFIYFNIYCVHTFIGHTSHDILVSSCISKTTFIFILRDSLPSKLDERGTCIWPLVDTDGLFVGINLPGVSGFPKISISGSASRFLLGNFDADVGALAIFHLPNVPYNHKTWRRKDVDKKFILN